MHPSIDLQTVPLECAPPRFQATTRVLGCPAPETVAAIVAGMNRPDFQDPRHEFGLQGEELAIMHFRDAGWSIEAHRFRVGRNELDLVVRRGCLVAFVEVKARHGHGFGQGREAIGWRKRQSLGRVAEVWRLRHGRVGDLYRFDVVDIDYRHATGPQLHHIEDAWRLNA
jgi:putative endonuclease